MSVGTLVANMVFDFNAENVLIMGATGVIGNIVLKIFQLMKYKYIWN